jgi:hypothetical protein
MAIYIVLFRLSRVFPSDPQDRHRRALEFPAPKGIVELSFAVLSKAKETVVRLAPFAS